MVPPLHQQQYLTPKTQTGSWAETIKFSPQVNFHTSYQVAPAHTWYFKDPCWCWVRYRAWMETLLQPQPSIAVSVRNYSSSWNAAQAKNIMTIYPGGTATLSSLAPLFYMFWTVHRARNKTPWRTNPVHWVASEVKQEAHRAPAALRNAHTWLLKEGRGPAMQGMTWDSSYSEFHHWKRLQLLSRANTGCFRGTRNSGSKPKEDTLFCCKAHIFRHWQLMD